MTFACPILKDYLNWIGPGIVVADFGQIPLNLFVFFFKNPRFIFAMRTEKPKRTKRA